MPTPGQLWLGFTIAVFLVYALVERKYHRLYGDALAQARKGAEAVAEIIDQALADTQEFIANARASLIAEQLAGRLRELIRQLAPRQFRQDYDNVVKVRGGRADALDPEETNAAAKLSDVARNAPLEQWIKEMIGDGRTTIRRRRGQTLPCCAPPIRTPSRWTRPPCGRTG